MLLSSYICFINMLFDWMERGEHQHTNPHKPKTQHTETNKTQNQTPKTQKPETQHKTNPQNPKLKTPNKQTRNTQTHKTQSQRSFPFPFLFRSALFDVFGNPKPIHKNTTPQNQHSPAINSND